jgi:hypothetical protein
LPDNGTQRTQRNGERTTETNEREERRGAGPNGHFDGHLDEDVDGRYKDERSAGERR